MSLLRADALTIPFRDESVDLCCFSPPYFALRSYTDDGEHYPGQIGSEATPAAFVDALVAVTRECVRVLKPSGSMWVNLGDKYAGGSTGSDNGSLTPGSGLVGTPSDRSGTPRRKSPDGGHRAKSLMGLPWRYALRCIDDLGLILRAEVIWSKPNSLPESVTDRVRRSHEQWFHFTREPRYFSAVDEIREPNETADRKGDRRSYAPGSASSMKDGEHQEMTGSFAGLPLNPLGKLPGSVWTIPTEPLRVPDGLPQHFAAFPSEWPKRIIQGWSPSGVCTRCGEGRRPEVNKEREFTQRTYTGSRAANGVGNVTNPGGADWLPGRDTATITGYSCACPTPDAPTTPAVVLDPFAGTGTTVAVANALGRHGIGIDLSADYLRLARWRCSDPVLRAKVLELDRPPVQIPGQGSLLEAM